MRATFIRMGRPRAQMDIGEEALTVSSDAGSSSIPYAKFKEVRRYPSVWLLVFDKSQFMTFPTQSVTEEAKNLLLSRFEKNGVKIA